MALVRSNVNSNLGKEMVVTTGNYSTSRINYGFRVKKDLTNVKTVKITYEIIAGSNPYLGSLAIRGVWNGTVVKNATINVTTKTASLDVAELTGDYSIQIGYDGDNSNIVTTIQFIS